VREMLDTMTPEQLDGWMAYDAIEPLASRGLYCQVASIIAILSAYAGVESTVDEHIPGLRGGD
jgi:hypothetical protein